jgi:hypothetical protein
VHTSRTFRAINNAEHARGLLDRIEALRDPSDVDLLIVFARRAHWKRGWPIRRALKPRPVSGEEVEQDG